MRLSKPDRLGPCLLAAALLLPAAMMGQQAGSSGAGSPQGGSPAASDAPSPKGTILFERHETPEAPPAEEPPAAPPPAGKAGVSSSAHTPRLRRRAATGDASEGEGAPVETEGTPPAGTMPSPVPEGTQPAQESSSSSSLDGSGAMAMPAITAEDLAAAAKVSAEARRSVAIAARQMDLHLNTHTGIAEFRAEITVRNAGDEPLTTVPLRVSGALRWESARLTDRATTLPVEQHHLRDDLDHTGVATEIALVLPEPLASGKTVKLNLFYGGTLGQNSSRLLEMGAPVALAQRTDWDTVTDTFSGLRGMGNVLWYPVGAEPALLRDGAAVTNAVESSRSREVESSFGLRLTLEYEGAKPDAAFLCGDRQALAVAADGIATADWTIGRLGLRTPSLFVTLAAPQEVAGGLARVVTDEADHAGAVGEAVARLRPLLEEWLGPKPSRALDVIDLPIPDASGFADGSLLVAPLRAALPEAMAPSLVGPLAAAWLPGEIAAPWLREGIPAFLQAVWAERTSGRTVALAGLAAESTRLRGLDSADKPQESSSSSNDLPVADARVTPLAVCTDLACDRGRAAYVLEMLRDMLGDAALEGALSGWRVAEETTHESAAQQTAKFEGLLRQVAAGKPLDWFLQSWVDGTGSLPQLSIVAVAPRKIERASAPANLLPQRGEPFAGPVGTEPTAPTDDPRARWGGDRAVAQAGSWLVAVEVQNAGGTDAQVPVTVRAGSLSNTLPLRVPAHGKATIRIPFEAEPEEVLVNDGSVPEAATSIHRRSITPPGR